jgi:hypothetical protein
MNTRSSSILMLTFEILVFIGVLILTTSVAQAFAKSETVTKNNAAEDIRQMTYVLVGVPGEALVEYPKDMSKFNFILRRESIIVFEKDEPNTIRLERKFILPDGYTAEGTLELKSRLCLEKKENKILLRECS